uniref:Photosystem I reaction center subunit XI n=1 Tax=Olisthodiscus luteus TaxID=83000 RepID=A0A7U0KSN7_OLILU|nr:photosystem I reaction center subunit XI [Olisthodiscus luteus]QQW50537.1 photosystem I reaction center subunit XI [Olisthodiscus luteus]
MANLIKSYNNDPFVGHLSTPITSSTLTKMLLSNLPVYRKEISPMLCGLEVGMAHGYFLLGPFFKLGPLRNTDVALLAGFFAAIGLVFILSTCLTIYGFVTFDSTKQDNTIQTSVGWKQFTAGFTIGGLGGISFAYLLLLNFL